MSARRNQSSRRIGWVRWGVRGFFCVIAALLAMQVAGPPWLSAVMPSLSPFTAVLAMAADTGGVLLLGALAVAVISLFSPRFFCQWVCPVGTCRDVVSSWVPRRSWVARVPCIGVWLVCIGTGGALLGYPLFGWLDPLVIFNAFFSVAGHLTGPLFRVAALGLPLLLLSGLIAPWLWCGKLCPLGATQDLLREWTRFRDWIRGRQKDAQGTVAGEQEVCRAAAMRTSRRVFLGLGLGAGYRLVAMPGQSMHPEQVLRPPSSMSAARFTRLCVRCGNCVRACPNGIIHFGSMDTGLIGVLAPEIRFDANYCPISCTVCGEVCPTGAIPRFTRETKSMQPIGCAEMNASICLLSENRECGTCVGSCPHQSLDFEWDPVEMVSRITVNRKACTGCGYCEYVCPTLPKAIRVKPV